MKRGTVVMIGLPEPDPNNPTHVQQGRRPAVIVQADDAREFMLRGERKRVSTCIVVPLTTQLRAQLFPGAIEIRATAENGLGQDSVALAHQILTVDVATVKRRLGDLGREDMNRLTGAMAKLLSIPLADEQMELLPKAPPVQ